MSLVSTLDIVKKAAKPVATIAGAAIGGAVGGPAGAMLGAKVGGMVGQAGSMTAGHFENVKGGGPGGGAQVPARASSIEEARGQDKARMKRSYGYGGTE